MNAYAIMGLTLFGLFILFFFKESFDYKKRLEKAKKKAEEAFGTFASRDYSLEESESIRSMFYRYQDEDSIDDITASDLSIDEIFCKYDNCLSAPGKEYFYRLLRTPFKNDEELADFEKKVSYFYDDENKEERNKVRSYFMMIGNLRRSSFFKCIDYLDKLQVKNLFKEYIFSILIFVNIGLMFVDATVGIISLVVVMCFNIVSYYKQRGEIESSIMCLSFIINLLKNAEELQKTGCTALQDDYDELNSLCKKFSGFKRFSSIVTNGGGANTGVGNPLDIFGDYIKMVFHLDIIRFYHMLGTIKERMSDIEAIYVLLGKIETYINVASIRKAHDVWCLPGSFEGIDAKNVYHPLIDDPVKNSITAKAGVLITGSNASGKSTFLKTIAINALFARTIHTCLADSFDCEKYSVFSSMSLRDDLMNQNSYFMVEIKSVKRIIDFINNNPDKKVLCFVDELLRGTNTIERIAACTEILKEFVSSGALCFAATHDYELTDILSDIYDNYHFEEEIDNDDIIFNYLLKKGKATSRNAIRLLSIMGFSDNVVDNAKASAEYFTDNSVWKKA